jgi:hypothetical protein
LCCGLQHERVMAMGEDEWEGEVRGEILTNIMIGGLTSSEKHVENALGGDHMIWGMSAGMKLRDDFGVKYAPYWPLCWV